MGGAVATLEAEGVVLLGVAGAGQRVLVVLAATAVIGGAVGDGDIQLALEALGIAVGVAGPDATVAGIPELAVDLVALEEEDLPGGDHGGFIGGRHLELAGLQGEALDGGPGHDEVLEDGVGHGGGVAVVRIEHHIPADGVRHGAAHVDFSALDGETVLLEAGIEAVVLGSTGRGRGVEAQVAVHHLGGPELHQEAVDLDGGGLGLGESGCEQRGDTGEAGNLHGWAPVGEGWGDGGGGR